MNFKYKKFFVGCFLISIVVFGLTGCKEEQEKFSMEKAPSIPGGLGVSIHSNITDEDIQMIADAGFKWVRIDIFWERVETKKGHYDFKNSGYDKLNKKLKDHNIKPYYILNYSNSLYEKDRSIVTDGGRTAFSEFVKATTKRYKNQGGIWEIWNEPNIALFWENQPSYEDYARLVKVVAPIIKKQDPSGLVVAPAISTLNNNGLSWLNEVLDQNILNEIDAISVHPYRLTSPETVVNDYRKLKKMIKLYTDKDIPIISSEWGYSMADRELPLTETQQAKYLTRMFLINLQEDIPVSIWYDWKNDGNDPDDKQHNYGITFNDSTQKLSYNAIQTLTTNLKEYTFSKTIKYGRADNHILEFKNADGKKALVFWTTGENYKLTYPLKSGSGKYYSMLGGMQRFKWEDEVKLNISSSPSYLIINDKK
ncbi:glycoside hydrolase family 5 protein [Priestia megaterium]|uniref:cellulase family glycosylhydrolase n=1 Tax=Priestia megaterium TaxID=1404 RepID=UPI002280E016|nr:cellulase family glycosylhydrolase [Priestia megaterium]MCY9026863.1 glycoside hydrolase family 5 protein [Priestia megaterium]